MFLFILESIGMSELILIGIVALIIFGPRKLPQIAKTVGKTMADFKNATNEFKETWEREASFIEESLEDVDRQKTIRQIETTVPRTSSTENADDFTPEIREVESQEIRQKLMPQENAIKLEPEVNSEPGKRDWL